MEALQRYQCHRGFCECHFKFLHSYQCREDKDEVNDIMHSRAQKKNTKTHLVLQFFIKLNLQSFTMDADNHQQQYNVVIVQ
jgi:hypothetical protein